MNKHNGILAAICIAGIVAIFLMLTMTSPTEIGPFGVLLFFTIYFCQRKTAALKALICLKLLMSIKTAVATGMWKLMQQMQLCL